MARARAHRARRSVRWRLVVVALITTAIALLVAGGALLTRDLSTYRRGVTTDLVTEASILALSTGPALAFDDHATANRNIVALSARPAVLAAAIYTADGRLYAQYVRSGEAPPPRQVPRFTREVRIGAGHIEITHRIVQKGEWVGTIYLRGNYNVMGRVATYLGILALVGLLSLGIALALSTLLQRSITEPLGSMAAIAQRVIEERDYSLRARSGGVEDEIGVVVDAFNAMLDEVQARTRDLVQSNTALTKEVEIRQAVEAALREADRRKDEFLATLAHELRNPLAPIRHAVKLLEMPATDERRREWCREVIGRQVQRMALLLDDLLDVSRITRGRLQLRKSHVELAAVVRSAVETARPLIDSKQHALDVRLPPEPIELEADPLRLSQALSNLLTNAAKYTDAGGRISLTAELDDELRFAVRDTGIGLAAAAIPTLFEMFSQVDSAIDRAEGGLGIGLALVKGLIGLHGGRVAASSEGPGRGSTFTIHLPRSLVTEHRSGDVPQQPAPRAADGPRCSVLVADDNRDAADSLALLLQAAGYSTYVAHSGRGALALASRERPDALILDIGMPDMTGYEVAQRIREEEWGRQAMLLAVTGWGQQEDKARAAAAGFDHHLTKPVAPDAVEALLSRFSQCVREGRSAVPT